MRQFLVLIAFLGLASQISAVYLDGLRVTWGPQPGNGSFTKLPRTALEAWLENWERKSVDCENEGMFSGIRYKPSGDEYINVLMDKNGIIAGVQALIPHDEMMNPDNPFRYDLVPMFQNETIDGRVYAVLTAYLVPPESICTTGRTEYDLIREGTGTGLWFQNGESPNAQIDVPLMRQDAAELGWTNCECFPGMGLHNFFEVDKWAETNCDRVQPTQATYNLDEEMTGFVFQISGPTSSPRFEHPPNEALYAIIGAERIPQCIVDGNTNYGFSTIHFYMVDQPWTLSCTP